MIGLVSLLQAAFLAQPVLAFPETGSSDPGVIQNKDIDVPVAPGYRIGRQARPSAPGKAVHQGRIEVTGRLQERINRLITEGMTHFEAGRLADAHRQFSLVLAEDPHNPNAHFNLGVMAEGSGNLERSLYHYQLADRVSLGQADIQAAIVAVENKLCARQLSLNAVATGQLAGAYGLQARSGAAGQVWQTPNPEMPVAVRSCRRQQGLTAGAIAGVALMLAVGAAPVPGGVRCPVCRIVRRGF